MLFICYNDLKGTFYREILNSELSAIKRLAIPPGRYFSDKKPFGLIYKAGASGYINLFHAAPTRLTRADVFP